MSARRSFDITPPTNPPVSRKHFLLIFDSYFFLALCIVDFVAKANDGISTSIQIFSVVDRVIGGLSGFPIVFYTLFLYLFARRHFILVLPTRFQWSVKILLTVLIPVILVLVELGSLLGYTYSEWSLLVFITFLTLFLGSYRIPFFIRTSRTLLHSSGENVMDAPQFCRSRSSRTLPIRQFLSRSFSHFSILSSY